MNKQELEAYAYAARLLARREYCTFEMRQRLANRDYDDETIAVVLAHLKQDNYLSEARFAESYLRSRMKKGEAPWLAAQKAKQKGVDHDVLEGVLAELGQAYDADETCRGLLASRDPAGLRFEDERVWQRQARFLRNKGFDTDTILRVLNDRGGTR